MIRISDECAAELKIMRVIILERCTSFNDFHFNLLHLRRTIKIFFSSSFGVTFTKNITLKSRISYIIMALRTVSTSVDTLIRFDGNTTHHITSLLAIIFMVQFKCFAFNSKKKLPTQHQRNVHICCKLGVSYNLRTEWMPRTIVVFSDDNHDQNKR